MSVLQFVQNAVLPAIPRHSRLSSSSTTTPSHPLTDLSVIEEWVDFPHAVRSNRSLLSGSLFQGTINNTLKTPVSSEQNVQAFADGTLHQSLTDILEALGHAGYHIVDITGTKSVILDPDRILDGGEEKPILTIEFKTPWAFPKLRQLVQTYQSAQPKSKVRRDVNQIYGYMTFNHHRYGVLTTYEETYFLQREWSEPGGRLQVAGPFSYDRSSPFTVLEAYTTLLLLCIDNWFYVSPTTSPAPSRSVSASASPSTSRPSTPMPYILTDVDINDVMFNKGRARARMGAVVEGTFRGAKVIFKIVDESKNHQFSTELDNEVDQYRALAHLQGRTIPRFLGYIRVWNMLKILGLEDCGVTLKKSDLTPQLIDECFACLRSLHQSGIVHGDVHQGNFVYHPSSGVRLLDLGFARTGPATDMEEEFEELTTDLE
ncbi:uncharacterized protein EV422DRAFT_122809 [Fimicolochytrium jonesii]|uniref:uncharacterized protein n=1 Tax=Fimicolochytrium jonesii TaxID=1396493 RepID=UPI0022FEBBE1|nr:uncharacterized protein EV422DRAFT_122809 [Fimicolochytrium jonesii]KAI8819251.1 hypothetical protein EV422DRAFT_122809 [Fimicolochytrium jonesii]